MTDETTTAAAGPSAAQLVSAFADAVAPFLGPQGLAIDAIIHAGLSFITNLQAQRASGKTVYTMDDLEAAAAHTTEALGRLAAAVGAQNPGDVAAAAIGQDGRAVASTQRMGIPKEPGPGSSQ